MGDYIDEVESENEDSEEEDEDVFDGPARTAKTVNNEHSDPTSYSWLVLKLATLKIIQGKLNDFLAVCYWCSVICFTTGNLCSRLPGWK